MHVYCVRCQSKTNATRLHRTGTAKHPRVEGTCTRCGGKVSQFVKRGRGFGSFFSKLVSNPIVQNLAKSGINAGANYLSNKLGGGCIGRHKRMRRRGHGIGLPGYRGAY